jgi:hypothetical protein
VVLPETTTVTGVIGRTTVKAAGSSRNRVAYQNALR